MAKTPQFPTPTEPGRKRTLWETILVTTPVILTVIATVLAGMSSSDGSQSQYFRAAAAQMQSKVSDQWGYFQAKKLRAEQCGNTIEILRGISPSAPRDGKELWTTASRLMDEMGHATPSADLSEQLKTAATDFSQLGQGTTQPSDSYNLANFIHGDIPQVESKAVGDQKIIDAIHAVDAHASEAELEKQAGTISQAEIDQAIIVADDNSNAFDKALDQYKQKFSQIAQSINGVARSASSVEKTLPANPPGTLHDLGSQLSIAGSIAQLSFNNNRYQREAGYNQVLAQLYEIQVRRQDFASDRHRERSREFFFGMLAAQAGVTIATFSLAVQKKNLLWGLAATVGLLAVSFGAYVYLFN